MVKDSNILFYLCLQLTVLGDERAQNKNTDDLKMALTDVLQHDEEYANQVLMLVGAKPDEPSNTRSQSRNRREVEDILENLLARVQGADTDYTTLVTRFSEALTKHPLSKHQCASLENLMKFAVFLQKFGKQLQKDKTDLIANNMSDNIEYLNTEYLWLRKWLFGKQIRVSEQECCEFQQEVRRLIMLLKFCKFVY